MKKGFTLIEMLVILIFLSVIALMAVPSITNMIKKGTDDKYNKFLDNVYLATEAYIEKYNDEYPNLGVVGAKTNIYMKDLVDEKLISTNLVNPKYCENGECITKKIATCSNKTCTVDDYTIIVTKQEDGKYKYELVNGIVAEPKSFENDSWDVIISAVRNNNTNVYKIGDTKEIDMGIYGKQKIRIANITSPEICETEKFSQTACGFVLEFENIIAQKAINSSDTNKGGWKDSEIRAFINQTIYNELPQELKEIIIDTSVVSSHGSSDTDNFITVDKLYLPSTKEIWGKNTKKSEIVLDSSDDNTRQLDYYSINGVSTESYELAKKQDGSNTTSQWLRSANLNYTNYFYYVTTSGDWGANGKSSNVKGISPAFRIG